MKATPFMQRAHSAPYLNFTFARVPHKWAGPSSRVPKQSLSTSRGWTRLEVTTPPLPQFDRTLAFYEREGFAISGGCKLKISCDLWPN